MVNTSRVTACGILVLSLAILAIPALPAHAGHIGCGAALGPGGSFALDSNVGPCVGPGAAITVDSAMLDLATFTVSCTAGDGLVLIGQKATLTNGTVDGCERGVVLGGTGRHRVSGVTSQNSQSLGLLLDIGSDKNRVSDSTVTGTSGDGVNVDSDKNRLERNDFSGNGSDGVEVNGDRNTLTGNTANDNGSDGIDVDGDDNKVVGNTANGNGDNGFEVDGDRNLFTQNTANGNDDDGFEIDDDDNKVKANVAMGNSGNGILVELGNTGNSITKNTATGNGVDLQDQNGDCASNSWKNNTFDTKSPACID